RDGAEGGILSQATRAVRERGRDLGRTGSRRRMSSGQAVSGPERFRERAEPRGARAPAPLPEWTDAPRHRGVARLGFRRIGWASVADWGRNSLPALVVWYDPSRGPVKAAGPFLTIPTRVGW